jgi:hypothetical protein
MRKLSKIWPVCTLALVLLTANVYAGDMQGPPTPPPGHAPVLLGDKPSDTAGTNVNDAQQTQEVNFTNQVWSELTVLLHSLF